MPHARQRRVAEVVAAAGAARGVRALENAHLIAEVPADEGDHAADAGGEVRRVRLEAAALERLFKALAARETLADGVGLVAVGHDEVAAHAAHRRVDDERRILDLRLVEGTGVDRAAVLGEDAVAAVGAAPHDEIGHGGLFAIRGLADDDAAAGIAVAREQLTRGFQFVDVHALLPSFSACSRAATISAACGSRIHSACSITRRCSVCGVSSGSTSTAFCSRIRPPSGISLT